MKILKLISLPCLFLLMMACEKPNDAPTPGPVVPPVVPPVVTPTDTLGAGWSQQKITSSLLSDIYFQNALVGYTGGDSIFKTNDGGVTWIKIPDAGNAINLLVTSDGVLHLLNLSGSTYKKFTNWAQNSTTTSPGAFGRANDLHFVNNNTGFITTDSYLLKTNDGGNIWERVTNTAGLQLQYYSGLSFLDSTTGCIFSSTKIFKANGSINNWTSSNLPANTSARISSIQVVSANVVYAGTFSGSILKSIDSGHNFKEVTSLATVSDSKYTDIHFLNELNGYACFSNGIYQTNNGGNTWTKVVALVGSSVIVEVHFVDLNHGWACTLDGKVLKYTRQ